MRNKIRHTTIRRVVSGWRMRFLRREDGNIALMAALAMLPLVLAVGAGLDYTSAARRQFQIDAMSDAAVLTAVTPSEMGQTCAAAQAQAQAFFNNQVASQSNIGVVSTVTVTGCPDAVNSTTGKITRTMTVTWTGNSANAFATAFGMSAIPIGGTSTAVNSVAPNINFYLLLDTSPSMALAGTSAGITQMGNLTTAQGSCQFACHESCNSVNSGATTYTVICDGDEKGNPYANGVSGALEDNYALARANNIPLRIDLVNSAVQDMFTLMQSTAAENGVTYQAALYTFDLYWNTIVSTPTNNFATLSAAVGTLSPFEYYVNNYYQTPAQAGTLTATNNNDESTILDTALEDMSSTSVMPNPGTGGSATGQTPQEVLLIVTDAMNDYAYGGTRYYSPIDTGPVSTKSTSATNGSWCTTIKNRGIRIAVLYTTYWPTAGWFASAVETSTASGYSGTAASVSTALTNAATNCASPGLFFQVDASTSGAVSSALQTLFQKIVSTAYLSN